MVELVAQVRLIVIGNALHRKRGEVLLEGSRLLFQDVHILSEVRFVELPETVLLTYNLLCRLQYREAVLRYESILVPWLAQLIVVGRSGATRHEDHEDGNGKKGEEYAVQVFPGAEIMLMIISAHLYVVCCKVTKKSLISNL